MQWWPRARFRPQRLLRSLPMIAMVLSSPAHAGAADGELFDASLGQVVRRWLPPEETDSLPGMIPLYRGDEIFFTDPAGRKFAYGGMTGDGFLSLVEDLAGA
jgi:hypothetical protein